MNSASHLTFPAELSAELGVYRNFIRVYPGWTWKFITPAAVGSAPFVLGKMRTTAGARPPSYAHLAR
ncbi:hypothetical protein [Pseudarthrobacter siccitolerans]|nr:hypothetical protein [Pseudarthrobacter siccitolerans]